MDADIEATVDQAVRQARDVAAFTRELLGYRVRVDDEWIYLHPSDVEVMYRAEDGSTVMRLEDLGCATCGGTGWVSFRDPDSARFPKRPRRTVCRDCQGTGRDPKEGKP